MHDKVALRAVEKRTERWTGVSSLLYTVVNAIVAADADDRI